MLGQREEVEGAAHVLTREKEHLSLQQLKLAPLGEHGQGTDLPSDDLLQLVRGHQVDDEAQGAGICIEARCTWLALRHSKGPVQERAASLISGEVSLIHELNYASVVEPHSGCAATRRELLAPGPFGTVVATRSALSRTTQAFPTMAAETCH